MRSCRAISAAPVLLVAPAPGEGVEVLPDSDAILKLLVLRKLLQRWKHVPDGQGSDPGIAAVPSDNGHLIPKARWENAPPFRQKWRLGYILSPFLELHGPPLKHSDKQYCFDHLLVGG